MSNPVVWFEIYVQDMARAKAFYEAVLAVKLEQMSDPSEQSEMCSFPMQQSGDGAAGALVRMAGVSSGGGGTLVYFRCADCAVEAGRIPAAGGTIVRPKFAIGPYGFIALATDPDGNMIGLHSTA